MQNRAVSKLLYLFNHKICTHFARKQILPLYFYTLYLQVGPGTSCTIITGSAKPEPKAQVQSGDAPSKLSTIKPVSVAPVRSQQSQGEC